MEIKNKKINFLGDSITEGDGVSSPDKKYVSVFERKYMPAAARNYGICGTRIARQRVTCPQFPDFFDLDFCSRVEKMDSDADIVVVFGGTNDFAHGDAPMGCFDDRTPDTFYGACHTLMTSLIEKYPEAVIVFITPTHREGENDLIPQLCEYVNAIKECANFYSIPVLDLFATAGIYPQIKAHKEAFCPDGLHPNDKASEMIADRLANFLLRL